jgi:hypothetical protein
MICPHCTLRMGFRPLHSEIFPHSVLINSSMLAVTLCNIRFNIQQFYILRAGSVFFFDYTVLSESRCALRLRYVNLVVSIEVAVDVFLLFRCIQLLNSG